MRVILVIVNFLKVSKTWLAMMNLPILSKCAITFHVLNATWHRGVHFDGLARNYFNSFTFVQ